MMGFSVHFILLLCTRLLYSPLGPNTGFPSLIIRNLYLEWFNPFGYEMLRLSYSFWIS